MPLKLDIVNDKVVITASMKLIPEIDKIITLPDKKKSNIYLMYIYLSSSLDEKNPYRDLPEAVKEKESLFRAFNTITKTELSEEEIRIIEPGRLAYIKYTENADERIISSFNTKIDELKILLDATTPSIDRLENAETGEIKYSTNTDILNKIMNNIDVIITKREKVKDSLLNKTVGRAKGGHSSSLIEKGSFKNL